VANLVETIVNAIPPRSADILSDRLGESPQAVKGALAAAIPVILGALANKTARGNAS